MTAVTISAPLRTQPRRSARTAPAISPVVRAGRARRQAAPVRLTRRGRLVLTGLLASLGIVASMFVGGIGFAGTQAEQVPVSYITVAPGETLWSIAGEVAPDADRRDTVARILDLNALESSGVRAGQRIAVPVP